MDKAQNRDWGVKPVAMRANIPIDKLPTSELLEDWNWLLREPCTLIAMNNFADMFLRDGKGKIHLLVVTSGSLTKIAESEAEFRNFVAATENQRAWFSLDLLTELEQAGMSLAPGVCFSFKKPLVLGGARAVSNIEVAPILVYVSMMGQIHQQLVDLPPGTPIAGIKIS